MVSNASAEARQTASQQPKRIKIPRGQLLINGTWREGKSGEAIPTIDPTTEEVITEVIKASPADADDAVDAAYRAFEEGPWRRMHLEERAKMHFKIADLMGERADDFALREAMDMGMPYHDFRSIIMPHCSGLFRFFGGLCMTAMNGGYRTSYESNLKSSPAVSPLVW
jgi:aldehyde dehydrogenase (NAD+)